MTMETHKNETIALLAGVGLGAAIMYFVDPHRGKARRHMLADQTAGALRDAGRDLEVTRRDLRNRAQGVAAELRQHVEDDVVSDPQLVERVRAELGHHVDSIRRLEISATNGEITLTGSIPADQHDEILRVVDKVRGVRQVYDQTGGVH
ncbi:MAG: BON domain-containing protein [Gemmatimonadota bacterium]